MKLASDSLHILHIIPFFTPQMGGSAQVCYQLARCQGEHGHRVQVLASDFGSRDARFPDGPFQGTFLPNLAAKWGFYFSPAMVGWSRESLWEVDVIHMHTFRTFQNAVAGHFARRYHIPYILSAHGTLPLIHGRWLPKMAYDCIAGRKVLAKAGLVVAVSEMEATQYRHAGVEPGRIRLVPNGLNLTDFALLPERGKFRYRYGLIGPDARVVLFLGRIHRIKGIDILLDAFARLPQYHCSTVLVIAGPDEGERENLERQATRLSVRDRVLFTGPLYGREKLEAYRDADVLATPSRYEIFGLVPFEALLCGTPVIVGESSGAGELLSRAGAAYLAPSGDVDSLAELLEQALTARGKTEAMVSRGQKFIREHLDWEKITMDIEEAYILLMRKGCRIQ